MELPFHSDLHLGTFGMERHTYDTCRKLRKVTLPIRKAALIRSLQLLLPLLFINVPTLE